MSSLLSRRRFLQAIPAGGLLLGACNSQKPLEGALGAMDRFNNRVQQSLFRPRALAPELPEGSETIGDDFPAYKIGDDFPTEPDQWVLTVGGLCSRPGHYTIDDLKKLPRTHLRVRHHCVEGWSAVSAWHGVRMSDLAQHVGADPKAGFVEYRSFEQGYYSSWDRASAFHPQTLLAYGRNGAPITREYGAPLRLYGAVKLGYKNVKWLTGLNFMPAATGGYWEDQGYEWFAGV
jgi:DMSO/TMAO reductase YedYZ molybdopterin-dependent catalytic subunit